MKIKDGLPDIPITCDHCKKELHPLECNEKVTGLHNLKFYCKTCKINYNVPIIISDQDKLFIFSKN